MMPGRIAAIVTCHDLGRTVIEALESVEGQTRPAAEIFVVDGASDDAYTRQLLGRLQRDGTTVIRTNKPGASAARNLGASRASADYLVCLDADDILEPEYFAAAAAHLDAEPDLDFVSCAIRAFGAASYVWRPSDPSFVEAVSTGAVPHASTMLRRRLWEQVGGFDEDIVTFELLDFWATVMEQGRKGIVLAEPWLRYRVRPGSAYRRSIVTSTYRARLEYFYGKHRAAVERHGLELIERKEAFFLSQREYSRTLQSRQADLEGERAAIKVEIAEVAERLNAHGVSRVDLGDLRRTQPISPCWGRDRGKAIDRHYVEGFLNAHRGDVRGRVIEVRDATYTREFGGNAVTSHDVLDIDPGNAEATIVADLRRADAIPSESYDCIILTQVLQLIDDVGAAVAECARILKPGGVLLATVPTTIRVDDEGGLDGDFWRLTEASARKVFAEAFPVGSFDVTPYGNVLACASFLYGMSVEEVGTASLDELDPTFPVLIGIRAVKTAELTRLHHGHSGSHTAAILAYHRIADLMPDSHGLCTPPDVFREQLLHLLEHFTPMALEDLVEAAASGRIPERAVAVTFDDGYVDALTVASPILTELGIPATFFVNTDRLNEEHERWWDVLEHAFSSGSALPDTLELTVGGQKLMLLTATREQRAEALTQLNRAAWPLEAAAREDLAAHVQAWSGTDGRARTTHRVMTGNEIRTLAARPGHAIGAHTTHHLALTTQSAETKRREVAENKAVLERLLQRPVRLFSYPYGEFDADLLTIVSTAGFRAAVTVEPGVVSTGANRLLLPRCEIAMRHRRDFPLHMLEVFDGCLLSR